MAEFTYSNAKNTNTDHTSFELHFGYYVKASYKKDIDSCSYSKSADKIATELRD